MECRRFGHLKEDCSKTYAPVTDQTPTKDASLDLMDEREAENATQGSTLATASPDNGTPAEKSDATAVVAAASVSKELKPSATTESAVALNMLASRKEEATAPSKEVQHLTSDVEEDAEVEEGGSTSVKRSLEELPEEV